MTGDDMTGDDMTGDDMTGDDMTGDDMTGDDMTGDDMTGDDRDELLALGAAGALSADEEVELEALLSSDAEAAARYAELLEDVTVLADAVAEAPPAHLRAAVLAAVAADGAVANLEASPFDRPPAHVAPTVMAPTGEPPELVPAAPTPDVEVDVDEDATPHVAPVIPIHRRRWLVPALAAAAAIVVVFGGLIVTRDADAPTDMAAAVLADDDAEAFELIGDLGRLRLVRSEENDAAVLVGDDITAPTDDRVLQLWALNEGDDPVGLGTFLPDDDGRVELVLEGEAAPPAAQYAITIEPEGGSDTPTMPIVATS